VSRLETHLTIAGILTPRLVALSDLPAIPYILWLGFVSRWRLLRNDSLEEVETRNALGFLIAASAVDTGVAVGRAPRVLRRRRCYGTLDLEWMRLMSLASVPRPGSRRLK
jgi:hypothetical protein